MKWSPEVKQRIEQTIVESLKYPESQRIAAFDADGTLWPGDAGENFFKHQIETGSAPGLANVSDPWTKYKKWEETEPYGAYSWLVEINTGVDVNIVREQARKFFRNTAFRISNPVREVITLLSHNKFKIWICSASMKYALEAILESEPFKKFNLIGFESELDPSGKVTKKIKEPMPYADGKQRALEKHLLSAPLICFGNSMGDLKLLEWARLQPFVLRYKPFIHENIKTEDGIGKIATERGWPLQIFST